MTARISMWSGPRNVSTALMYSFRQRSDTVVVDEPLYGHYLKATGAEHPGAAEVMADVELDAARAVEGMLHGHSEREVVFFKNMAHHLRGLDSACRDRLFSGGLSHALLIRDPREMLPSLARVLERPRLVDTGLVEQCEILEREVEAGRDPVVIDSRDLLRDPPGALRKLCERLGLGFESEMLSWPRGPKPEDGVWAAHWYASVHRSVGFATHRPPSEPFPEELSDLLEECRPYYARLAERTTGMSHKS
ncbi:MAG TPA: sulfotransferase family protein [Trueperaceae bacterium]